MTASWKPPHPSFHLRVFAIGLGLVVLVVAIVVITLSRGHSESQLANGWNELGSAFGEALTAAGSGSSGTASMRASTASMACSDMLVPGTVGSAAGMAPSGGHGEGYQTTVAHRSIAR